MAECIMPVGCMTKTNNNLFDFWWDRPYPWIEPRLCVTGCKIGDHYIAVSKVEHKWVIKPFIKGEEEGAQSGADITQMLFTQSVSESCGFLWKPLKEDRLPAGTIRCLEVGEFGNMYVGKHVSTGVGMVVSRETNKWFYYTHENPKPVIRNVYVLCIVPSK